MSIITRISVPFMGLLFLLSSSFLTVLGGDSGDLAVAPQRGVLQCDTAVSPVIGAALETEDVRISWADNLANTEGYKLWFGTGNPYQLTSESVWVTLPAGSTSYLHESIYPAGRARQLFYVVRGVSDCAGDSSDSNIEAVIGRGFSPEIDLAPQAIFNHTPISGTVPLTVTFNNQSQNGEQYLWSFGDGVTSTEMMPTHLYTNAGYYTVTLTVSGRGVSDEMVAADMVTVSNLSSNSCDVYPIAINESTRSLTDPNDGFFNAFPDADEFTYPDSPPTYADFPDHTEHLPFDQAEEGDLFFVEFGNDSSQVSWLVWNGYISASASALADSLSWPGNSMDYVNQGSGDWPQELSDFYGTANPVVGYINPQYYTDSELGIGDWVTVKGGSVNTTGVRDALSEHVDLGRILPVLAWDESLGSGGNQMHNVSRFILVRLVGYRLYGGSGDWLLVEFVEIDHSCG